MTLERKRRLIHRGTVIVVSGSAFFLAFATIEVLNFLFHWKIHTSALAGYWSVMLALGFLAAKYVSRRAGVSSDSYMKEILREPRDVTVLPPQERLLLDKRPIVAMIFLMLLCGAGLLAMAWWLSYAAIFGLQCLLIGGAAFSVLMSFVFYINYRNETPYQIRVDDEGIHQRSELARPPKLTRWSQISACDIVTVHDVYGKLQSITCHFTNKREKKILTLPLGTTEDAERFLNYFRMRFVHRDIVKYEQYEPTTTQVPVAPAPVTVKLPDVPGENVQVLRR